MPKRKSIRRVESTQVQGADSWVEFTAPRGKDGRQLIELGQQEGSDLERYKLNGELLVKFVHAWNWVDDDGEPLPQLKEDESILDELTLEEIGWLGQHVVEGAKSKN